MTDDVPPDSILGRLRAGKRPPALGVNFDFESLAKRDDLPEPVIGPIEVVVVESRDKPPAKPTPPRRNPNPAPPRRVGAPEQDYPREQVARVLVALRNGQDTLGGLARTSGLSVKAVRRIKRLAEHGGLELGPRGGLRCARSHGEFGHARKFVSLRELERALGLGPLS